MVSRNAVGLYASEAEAQRIAGLDKSLEILRIETTRVSKTADTQSSND